MCTVILTVKCMLSRVMMAGWPGHVEFHIFECACLKAVSLYLSKTSPHVLAPC